MKNFIFSFIFIHFSINLAMGATYTSVMNWGQEDPESEQRELNQRYSQIRTAN